MEMSVPHIFDTLFSLKRNSHTKGQAKAVQTTEKLFTLALKGNVLAAQRFTAVALPPLVRLAWRMLGDQAEAEDIAQETFLRAWRKGQSWDPGGTASIMTLDA